MGIMETRDISWDQFAKVVLHNDDETNFKILHCAINVHVFHSIKVLSYLDLHIDSNNYGLHPV